MASLNKVTLIGRLGQDPESRSTQSGNTIVNVNLATSEYFKDKAGNRQEKTEWHKLVFWNRQAEIVSQYCRKGSHLYVEGSLQTREWQDKDGNKRYTTEIVVRSMQMLDSRNQQQSPQQNNSQQQPRQHGNQFYQDGPPPGFIDDDIPF